MAQHTKPIDIYPGIIKSFLVTGGSADTNLTCTGIKVGDHIVGALEFAATSNDPTDRTAVASVVADGNIQFSVATTGDKIWVQWQPLR